MKTFDEDLSSRPIAECTSAEVAEALTRSFEGYAVPLRFTPEAYERRFRGEDLDPYASRVYERNGAPAGVVLIARRGWTSRVAAMGIVPGLRGGGVGQKVMAAAIAEARARGERTMILEVIEGNAPAVALYTKLGFVQSRRLAGYRWEPPALEVPEPFEEMDPLEFARLVAREGEADPPWNLAAETLSAASSPARAYRMGDRACALIADPDAERLALTAIVVPRAHRRQGWGTRLLHALSAAFPGRPWAVSPVVPEGLAEGFFASLGWERQPISQWEMVLAL
ncbi:MAG TPA: GNAT family N-acetyltransferase [Thermoanaerobaculia bacterium]|nr:GNAT family N-acetyltransferase [Thermoanaerobaculia bacterium]